jgi:glycine/D-amino acid oxidase-like deaminating enzyme
MPNLRQDRTDGRRDVVGVWPESPPTDGQRAAYADAAEQPFWLDTELPDPRPPLVKDTGADLVIVGGGLTGLWAALLAAERYPGQSIALIEGGTIASGASGRNGGFMSSSLVHGIANGLSRFPDEVGPLEQLGLENIDQIEQTLHRFGIECSFAKPGAIEVAMTDGQLAELEGKVTELRRFGHDAELLDADRMRREVDSPLFTGGLWQKTGECSVDPVALAHGLAEAAEGLGVTIYENTEMTDITRDGAGVAVKTPAGTIKSRNALLATAAFRSPVRAIRARVIPVFDYVLVTEPLSPAQWDAVGWKGRQGLSDSANRFHYYRPVDGDRILWGGYDAIYHYGGRVEDRYYQRDTSFAGLSQRFFTAFPQLEGVRFTHRWGGAIDTCSRFFAFYGTTLAGRVSYAVGHTGLGVGASRFAARVGLSMLDGTEPDLLAMDYVRKQPVPFPPEPLRWATIELTRNRLAAADRRDGREGVWLKTLQRLGLGFDS